MALVLYLFYYQAQDGAGVKIDGCRQPRGGRRI
jgi:hypothetical protein